MNRGNILDIALIFAIESLKRDKTYTCRAVERYWDPLERNRVKGYAEK